MFFLILVFYTSFSIIFGILEGLFQVFWYPTTPPGQPGIEFQELLEIFWEMYPFNLGKFFTFTCIHTLHLQKKWLSTWNRISPGLQVFHIPLCPWLIACSLGSLWIDWLQTKELQFRGPHLKLGQKQWYTSNQLFENQCNKICSYLSEKASKGTFLKHEKLQNHSNEERGKDKKKEQGEGKEEKKKKAMVALLVFMIVTLGIPKIDRERILYNQF